MSKAWVPHDVRDTIVDYVRYWVERTEIPARQLVSWLGIALSKFYDWRSRYGLVNEHNAHIPRDWWLEDWEKKAIIAFHLAHCLEGYRRLTFMMLDADVVAVSASSVYRVLRDAGLMERHNVKPSKKGKGFEQPLRPHEHWHVDVSYINVAGTYFFLCSLLDGCSRLIVHWEIREQMTEADVETIIQRGRERYPDARPRIISDNGPQFIAKGCDRRMMLTYFGCHLCITRPPETPIGRSLPRTDSIAPLCASSTVGSTPPPLQILSISSPSRRAVV